MTEAVRINGANHTAIDTNDGYYLIRNVPIFHSVAKGVKGAPKDIGEDFMRNAVKFAQSEYRKGSFAIPIHKGHHREIAFEDPEFLGFALPTSVGRSRLANGVDGPCTFADFKLKKAAFERARGGELPYISPEVDWKTGTFSSVSMLDSKSPHFHFPMFTIGEVKVDPMAKFEATTRNGGKFMEDDKKKDEKSKDAKMQDKGGPDDSKIEKLVEAKVENFMKKHKMGKYQEDEDKDKKDKAKMQDGDKDDRKPDGKPHEPDEKKKEGSAKMEMTPEIAAKFAALEDKNAQLLSKFEEREKKDQAIALEREALEDLKAYDIGSSTKAKIAEFARAGKESLDSFVATVKELSSKRPPSDMADFESGEGIEPTDPVLAKFQSGGPEKVAAAAKFAGEYRVMKQNKIPVSFSEEDYVNAQFNIFKRDQED